MDNSNDIKKDPRFDMGRTLLKDGKYDDISLTLSLIHI